MSAGAEVPVVRSVRALSGPIDPSSLISVLKTVPLRAVRVPDGRAMDNTVTAADIKRRGMAAIEEGLRRGPLRIIKRNRSAAVVLTEEEYARLVSAQPQQVRPGMTALQWLLTQPGAGTRDKADIDAGLAEERSW